MSVLDSPRDRAAALICALGAFLLLALAPFLVGLLTIPVLYVLVAPAYHRCRAAGCSPRVAAAAMIALVVLGAVVPALWLGLTLADQIPDAVAAVLHGPQIATLRTLHLGPLDVGRALANAERSFAEWASSQLLDVAGAMARLAINILITLIGLYSLLLDPARVRATVESLVPFSPANTERLRLHFVALTWATVVGTALNAVLHGVVMGTAFALTGMTSALLWGTIAGVCSVVPVIGAAVIWGPAAVSLLADGRPEAACFIALVAMIGGAAVDNTIRPLVIRRFANIHPMVAVVGTLAGLRLMGPLGLLVGPLAISYFADCCRMFREEHPGASQPAASVPQPMI